MDTRTRNLALVAIAVLGFMKFVWVPWSSWVEQTADNIARMDANIQKFNHTNKRSTQLAVLTEEIETGYSFLEQGMLAVSGAQASVAILRQVQSLAKQHGVTLSSSNVGSLQAVDVAGYPVKLFFKASPEASLAYLESLELAKPSMVVATMSMRKPNFKSTELAVSLELFAIAKPEDVQ